MSEQAGQFPQQGEQRRSRREEQAAEARASDASQPTLLILPSTEKAQGRAAPSVLSSHPSSFVCSPTATTAAYLVLVTWK